jgi:hypothetical protein
MRKCIGTVFVASVLSLAGCCSTPSVTRWEYNVASPPLPPRHFGGAGFGIEGGEGPQAMREAQQAFLNELGKQGWMLVSQTDGRVFYFRRPIR